MYTAVVLTPESRSKIMQTYKNEIESLGNGFQMRNAQGQDLLHHVTINMGDIDRTLNPAIELGTLINMRIVGFGHDEKVAAFRVGNDALSSNGVVFGTPPIVTANNIPHITAAINPLNGGKPFLSNQIKTWSFLPKLEISGILQVVN